MQSFKNEINSQKKTSDTIIFTFGRMNPPTCGHIRLINFIKEYASDNACDYRIYLSQTSGDRDNPLTYSEKIKFLQLAAPGANIVYNTNIKTVFDCLNEISNLGYSNVIFSVGRDQIEHFKKVFTDYVENSDDFSFKSVHVISSGGRTQGISASNARYAALTNNFDNFIRIAPDLLSNADVKRMYDLVRQKWQ